MTPPKLVTCLIYVSFNARFCACWGIPARFVPALCRDPKWQAVQTIYGRWRDAVKAYVLAKQESDVFGQATAAGSSTDKKEEP